MVPPEQGLLFQAGSHSDGFPGMLGLPWQELPVVPTSLLLSPALPRLLQGVMGDGNPLPRMSPVWRVQLGWGPWRVLGAYWDILICPSSFYPCHISSMSFLPPICLNFRGLNSFLLPCPGNSSQPSYCSHTPCSSTCNILENLTRERCPGRAVCWAGDPKGAVFFHAIQIGQPMCPQQTSPIIFCQGGHLGVFKGISVLGAT